jgi:arginyl-tRNA synthetase
MAGKHALLCSHMPVLTLHVMHRRYLYATVDIVAIRQRIAAGHDHIIYVTDSSQALHFSSLFAVHTLHVSHALSPHCLTGVLTFSFC